MDRQGETRGPHPPVGVSVEGPATQAPGVRGGADGPQLTEDPCTWQACSTPNSSFRF